MNCIHRSIRLAVLALSVTAAGSALAEGPVGALAAPLQATPSTLTRAAVTAQVLQAQRAGTLAIPEVGRNRHTPVPASTLSRETVRAMTLDALASGEAQSLGAETNAFSRPAVSALHAAAPMARSL
jgi:hypothetical protein